MWGQDAAAGDQGDETGKTQDSQWQTWPSDWEAVPNLHIWQAVETLEATVRERGLESGIPDSLRQEGARAEIADICEMSISNENSYAWGHGGPLVLMA